MHVDSRFALSQLWGSLRATWPRKRRKQRRQRRPRRKRSNCSTKSLSIWIASEIRCALCSTDGPHFSPTEYPQNKLLNQSDRYADGGCITVRFFIGT